MDGARHGSDRRRGRDAGHLTVGNLAAVLPDRQSFPARTRRAAAVAAALLATVGLAACTSEQNAQTTDFTGPKGEVQKVVERLSDLADRGDASTICKELLGDALVKSLGGADCEAGVKAAINGADYTNLDVASVDVDTAKTSAIARIKPVEDSDARRAITLSRADDKARWQIVALDPTGKTQLPEAVGTTPASTTPAETTPGSTPKE